MIKLKEELKLKVKKARLLTREELADYKDQMPEISMGCCWWLADKDDDGYVAYAEGNYTEEDMYCIENESNMWLRIALEIKGNVDAGDRFVHCGYVFTVLSEDLAISDNVLGCLKYSEDELLQYVGKVDDECTIYTVISTMIQVDDDLDDYDTDEARSDVNESTEDESDDDSVVAVDEIDDETRALLKDFIDW